MGFYNDFDSRDIVADFDPILGQAMEGIWAPQVAWLNDESDREVEEYKWLGSVPQLKQWIGAREEEQLAKYSQEIRNFTYESTLPIPLNDLRRDKTGQIRARVGDLARRTASHWNKILSPYINTGTAGTNGLAYDGQFFYDTDHNESGSNQSNDLTATEIPSANVATPAAPTADEYAKVIVETVAYMEGLTDDQGEPINTDISRVEIHVSKATHAAAARQAIALNNLTAGATNPVQSLANMGIAFTVRRNPRLTAADAAHFFLLDDTTDRPFILQDEQGVETQLLGAGSDEEFKNDRHVFGVRAVRGVGYGRWQRAAYVAFS